MGKHHKKKHSKKSTKLNNSSPVYPKHIKQGNVVDYLTVDPPLVGQDFVCLSFATVGDSQREEYIKHYCSTKGVDEILANTILNDWLEFESTKRGIKVRGCFPDMESARHRCANLRAMDADFDIFLGQVGYWGPFAPDPSTIGKEDYQEKELNDLIKNHKIQRMKSKAYFEKRKTDMMQKAIQEGTSEGQQILMDQKEPLEAVQYRIDSADDSIRQYQEKIDELLRAKNLAENKLFKMNKLKDQGEEFPTMDEVEEQKRQLDNPSIPEIENDNVGEDDIQRVVDSNKLNNNSDETQAKLDELREIEYTRKQLSDVTTHADTNVDKLFNGDNINPHAVREIVYEENDNVVDI